MPREHVKDGRREAYLRQVSLMGERVRSEESTRNRDKVVHLATGLERRGAYVVCLRVVVGYLLEEAGRLIGEGIQFVASPEKGRTRGVRRVELG